MRAKLEIRAVIPHETHDEVQFAAVGGTFDAGGNSEDNTFAKWTPTADLNMSITNPELRGQFEVGQMFYVDFSPADPTPA